MVGRFTVGDVVYIVQNHAAGARVSKGDMGVVLGVGPSSYDVRMENDEVYLFDDNDLVGQDPRWDYATLQCSSVPGTIVPYVPSAKEATGGLRYDKGKVKLGLISAIAQNGLGKVLTYGAKKYHDHNWRKGMDWSRCIDSLTRHWNKFLQGEDYDYDPSCEGCQTEYCKDHSWELHIDCIQCNSMFLSEYYTTHPELDDRYKTTKSSVPPSVQKTASKPNGNKE